MSIAPGDPSTQRVGDAERQTAIAQLRDHWQEGRLDPTEHEARTTKAYAAVTRGDLDALFADLPALPSDAATSPGSSLASSPGGGTPPGQPGAPGTSMPATGPVAPTSAGQGGLLPEGSWLHGKRTAIMAVTPFVALALFFITGQWLFFLLIPALGAILFAGGDDDDSGKRQRRRDRDERRRLERGE